MGRVLLTIGAIALFCGSVSAQPFGQNNQPTVSPYLNLLRPGNSPGFNYYGLVRPLTQMQNDIQSLQYQTNYNRTAITDINGLLVPTTGHTTAFLNTSSYYPRPNLGQNGQRQGGANAGRGGGSSVNQGVPQTGAGQAMPATPSLNPAAGMTGGFGAMGGIR